MNNTNILMAVIFIIVSILLLEASVRIFLPGTPLHPQKETEIVEFSHQDFRMEMLHGPTQPQENPVTGEINGTVTYHRHGFKRWGATETNRTKVLFIGDSHTEMRIVPNGKEWYAYLEESYPQKEFFVYGAAATGTLEQFLVFNETVDQIDPDIVIWQFCPSNDYRDNSYRWNRIMFPINQGVKRPFLIDGEIEYRSAFPLRDLREKSKVADFIVSKYQYIVFKDKRFSRLKKEKLKSSGNILQENPDIKEEAYDKTVKLMRKAIERPDNASFHLIKISQVRNFRNQEMSSFNICESINVSCIEGVNQYVAETAREENRSFMGFGRHWNVYGNKLAGEYIVEYFKKHKMLETR